jgi:ABC-type sulfate/molybdate transport systems ATPase subunit
LGIAGLVSRHVRTLSGGEAQRTSLARALDLNPELLLLDEPFAALHAPTREALLMDLQEILKETGITTVLVTHDLHEAGMMGKRIRVLNDGKLLQLASSEEVPAHPASAEVAAIVGVNNCYRACLHSLVSVYFLSNGGKIYVRSPTHPKGADSGSQAPAPEAGAQAWRQGAFGRRGSTIGPHPGSS